MKKLLLYVLSLSMITLMILTGVSAADSDDSLIIHYDFSGTTEDEMLSDKAGSSKENLTISNLNDGMTRISDGLAVVDGELNGNYFYTTIDMNNGDGKTITTEATIFVVAKTYSSSIGYNGWTDFFHVEGLSRVFISTCTGGTYGDIGIRSNYIWGENYNFKATTDKTGASFFTDEWVYMAVTYKLDPATQKIAVKFYFSDDNGNTYTEYVGDDITPKIEGTIIGEAKEDGLIKIHLGETIGSDPQGKSRGMWYEYKDFRVYNTALGIDDLVKLKGEAPDDTDDTDATTPAASDEITTPEDTGKTTTPTTETKAGTDTKPGPADDNNNSALIWIIVGCAVAIIAVVVVVVTVKKGKKAE